jgi:hypothetical protein
LVRYIRLASHTIKGPEEPPSSMSLYLFYSRRL